LLFGFNQAGGQDMRSLRWLVFSGLLAILLPDGFAQKSRISNEVQVQVRYPNGTPAEGVLIELDLENGDVVQQSQTDSSGRCHFTPGASSAAFLVRAIQPGYLEAKVRVDLQNTHLGIANLALNPIPEHALLAISKDSPDATVSVIDLSVPEPARKEYDLGRRALEKRDLDRGIAHLKKAIILHEQFPQAYTLLGMVYNEQRKWKEAEGALEKAIEEHAKAIEVYFQLGACLNQQKDYAGAVKALSQGLQLNADAPYAAAAHYELGRAYVALGQWQDADPHAAKAVAMQPDVALWHILMGNIDLKKGDGQGAINEFQAYLKLDPNGPAAASIHDTIPKIQTAMAQK
jgi:tetratricopeptide (TPR) repeat protein